MAHPIVSEDLEGILARLFYAAGAISGIASGLLEVTASLILAGLHAAFTKDKNILLDASQKQKQARQLSWLAFAPMPWAAATIVSRRAATAPGQASNTSPAAPSTPKMDDPVLHVPAIGKPSGSPPVLAAATATAAPSNVEALHQAAPASPPSLPVEVSWTADAGSPADVDTLVSISHMAGDGCLLEAALAVANPPTLAPSPVATDGMKEPGGPASAIDTVMVKIDGVSTPPQEATFCGGAAVDAESEVLAAAAIIANTTASGGDADGLPDMSVPSGSEVEVDSPSLSPRRADGNNLEPNGPDSSDAIIWPGPTSSELVLETVPEPTSEPKAAVFAAPQPLDSSPSSPPSQSVTGHLREAVDETRSESGECGITAMSYRTSSSADPVRGAPLHSRRRKTASSGDGSSGFTAAPTSAAGFSTTTTATATMELPYAQRLEEKRQKSRRMGAQKAKARG